ncbi:N-formylglutamate deformylase [Nevskia sp.]|uniref:N-formylglutamate deformylase n=1 Tax=Nevskia sp. TaxID=1929292 RepID=UPI0025D1B4DB|nr:N-formylglutamate deformylase [Nevskia sp.]
MSAPLALTIAGRGPLIINIPHAGTTLASGLSERLTDDARQLPDTDWHLPFLYHFAAYCGATLIAATHSRYVIDLNRDREGQPLYPGDPDPGLCPLIRFDGEPIYAPGCEPNEAEVEARRARWWDPYQDQLAQLVSDTRARCGHVVLLDAHSVRRALPARFEGALPDLNLATCDGESCAPSMQDAVTAVLAESGYSHAVNELFKGGYTTQLYGQPKRGLHALQLELVQDCYLDEADPAGWAPSHPQAQKIGPVLRKLVDTLVSWKP